MTCVDALARSLSASISGGLGSKPGSLEPRGPDPLSLCPCLATFGARVLESASIGQRRRAAAPGRK